MIANMRLALLGALAGAAVAMPTNGTEQATAVVTEVVTAITTYCPGPTTLTHGTKTYTVTEATTLTITDCPCTITKPAHPEPTHAPEDQCLATCNKQRSECQTAPDANQSTCAAQYAACIGYNPYPSAEGQSYVEPTACSTDKPEPTEEPAQDECLATCNKQRSECQTAPDANQSTCAAQFAACIGFNPYGTGPNGTYVEPTACAGEPSYVTETVTAITTYCPSPTTITHGSQTYTVSTPTTLTITDCPCTVTRPVEPTGVNPGPPQQPTGTPGLPQEPHQPTSPPTMPTGAVPAGAAKVGSGVALLLAGVAALL